MAKKSDVKIKLVTADMPEDITAEELEQALRPCRQALIRALVQTYIREHEKKEGA